ncbi:DNA-binding response regulator, NarL/FixJ family, contains REC and HTH domains [Paraoerskovia marina]|uniref:DNA-binding response regulator, NarL/FixJ family, contains REC and HTH domains n=1 Tax=Paraoerskovia marina TaxID=545619 RepID=A0A1H1ML90_9CELL|nr:response regulator transcription factor [Paraoerskovia marina]SDR87370.1 DNA-binding response regulator, NarL/FixJ family, contains REC and HTH domains [Paraoerskovia marina]
MTTVLIVDDQELIRAGLAALVDSTDDLQVVGQASDGAEAVRLARTARPDVVLMDIRMPGTDGLEATEQICALPELAGTRVVVLTTVEADEQVLHALRVGASGFLGKGVRPQTLLDGIRTVAAGESLLSPTATRALVANYRRRADEPRPDTAALDALTPREREVVALVAEGLSNEQIAERLVVSPHTAKTHVNRAMVKVGARDRAQLVVVAFRGGLGGDVPQP